jgi:hypothetical protein
MQGLKFTEYFPHSHTLSSAPSPAGGKQDEKDVAVVIRSQDLGKY